MALTAGIRDDSVMVKMTRAFVNAGHLVNRIVPSEYPLDSVEREVVWKRKGRTEVIKYSPGD